MTIKEVEEKTGLARSNLRFYEKEKLIEPERNASNGYRKYAPEDVEKIKKIAYLRTLGISIEEIREIIERKKSLKEVLQSQCGVLDEQIGDLKNARELCGKMLLYGEDCFEKLEIDRYVSDVREQWESNREIFRIDSVSFLYLWGGLVVWIIITALCLLGAVLFFPHLPLEIPMQWNHGRAVNLADRNFIFVYPAVCVLIRLFIRPVVWEKVQRYTGYGETTADYVTNSLCFFMLSVEIFTVLFVNGIAVHFGMVVLFDLVVLMSPFVVGWGKAVLRTDRKK